jgi:hypothetical protein
MIIKVLITHIFEAKPVRLAMGSMDIANSMVWGPHNGADFVRTASRLKVHVGMLSVSGKSCGRRCLGDDT